MTELPLWTAHVECGEVQFEPANKAARITSANVEYPWNEPLVGVSKVRERLEAFAQGLEAPRADDPSVAARAVRAAKAQGIRDGLAAVFPDKETE